MALSPDQLEKQIAELRKEWKLAKKALKECGVDLKGVADKPGFGPALDDVSSAYDSWAKFSGDQKKEDKLADALKKSAKSAQVKGGAYSKILTMVQKHLKKENSADAKEKVKLTGVDMALDKLGDIVHILDTLSK